VRHQVQREEAGDARTVRGGAPHALPAGDAAAEALVEAAVERAHDQPTVGPRSQKILSEISHFDHRAAVVMKL
jgi:hypothetical protein